MSDRKTYRGIVPLIVVLLIVLAVGVAGGGAILLATGNGAQVETCLENMISGNPAAVGALVAGLSTNVEADGEAALQAAEALGPGLGKCLLLALWDDAKVALARNAALKANAPLVAPAATIKANAMALSIKHGWSPSGAACATGSSSGTAQSGTIGTSGGK